MKSRIQPGSKMDKLVKLFVAMRAIIDLTPAGGLSPSDPFLRDTHMELEKRFLALCDAIGVTEVDALQMCKAEVD